MHERLEKIKAHVIKHKTMYISTGVGILTAGFTYVVMRKNSDLLCGSDSGLLRGSEARSFLLFSKVNGDQNNKAVVSYHTGERGSPGFVTRSLDTGQLFATQSAAAEAFDISPSILSSHLNGKFDDAEGFHFERIGVLV